MSVNIVPMNPEDFGDNVRFTPEGKISVLDGIAFAIGSNGDTARQNWKRLRTKHPEVVTKCHSFKFPGRGQQLTPVADLQVFLEIVTLLPGKLAAQVRSEAVRTLIRAMNGDPTLAEEIIERISNPDDLKRIEARARGKQRRIAVTATWAAHGIDEPWKFGYCTNQTYLGLYGAKAQDLKIQKGLSKKANLRNAMTTQELIEVAFTEDLADRKIRKENSQGYTSCGVICNTAGQSVAQFMEDFMAN